MIDCRRMMSGSPHPPAPASAERGERGDVRLANAWLSAEWDSRRGLLELRTIGADAWSVLSGASAGYRLSDGRPSRLAGEDFALATRPFEAASGSGAEAIVSYGAEQHDGVATAIRLRVYQAEPILTIQVSLRNPTATPIRVADLCPLRVIPAEGGRLAPELLSGWSFYKQGWQSWSPTASRRAGNPALPDRPPMSGPSGALSGELTSHDVAVLQGEEQALLVGFLTLRDQFAGVRFDSAGGAIEAIALADDMLLMPGAELRSETLLLDPVRPPLLALPRYAELAARENGARPWPAPPTGWVSWYCYFGTITAGDIIENLDALDEMRGLLPVEYLQIDDGFETDIGDWLGRSQTFPAGMAEPAAAIRAAGFRPGLWLAPFAAAATSRLAREHPDWLIHDARGEPVLAIHNWGKRIYGLDCTHPEVIAELERLISTVTRDWGYRMLKLDFLFTAALAGQRHDPTATRAQAYRRGLEAIRRAAGDDVLLLGSGAPLGPAVGIVDAMRVSPDVTTGWRSRVWPWQPEYDPQAPRAGRKARPATENAIRDTLNRWWMQGTWWQNDPDALMVRHGQQLSLDETRSRAAVVGLSGGMVMLSDFMARLDPERARLAALFLPPYGRAAVPLDLFECEIPEILCLDIERPFGAWKVVGVFNWGDRPARRRLDLARLGLDHMRRYHAHDLWSGATFGPVAGTLDLGELPAHSCRLLAIRPVADIPSLVGTDLHFTQGGVEVEDARFAGDTLTVDLALPGRREGVVYLQVPPAWRPVSLRLDGRERPFVASPAGRVSCGLRLDGRARIELTCRPTRRAPSA